MRTFKKNNGQDSLKSQCQRQKEKEKGRTVLDERALETLTAKYNI